MNRKSILSIALAAALSMAGSAIAADKIRLGTEGAYAPYNFMNDEGKLAGFEIDLGNAMCEEMKAECEWVVNEWDSIIPNLVAGNYDAIMAGMSITDERKKTITFSEEYMPVDPSMYIVAKGTELNWDSLEGKSIGVQGATIQAAFAEEKYGKNNTIKSYEKGDQTIADLMAGNLDTVLADGEFLKPAVKGSEGAMEFSGPEEMIGGGIGVGMRQDDADLHKKMNDALAALKKSGKVDELIAKYFDGKGPFYKE
ncbi:MAG: transporter substrate-binding domain-containing protein [Thiolinea sp.]